MLRILHAGSLSFIVVIAVSMTTASPAAAVCKFVGALEGSYKEQDPANPNKCKGVMARGSWEEYDNALWYVNGKRLGQGETKQLKLQAKGTVFFKGQFLGGSATVVIECHNSNSEGAGIEGPGSFQGQGKGRIVFEQCKTVFKPSEECSIAEPIKTNQIKSYLAYNPNSKQQKFTDVLEPQQGTVLAVFKFIGKGCLFSEAALEGSVATNVIPIEKESQELLLNFPNEPITKITYEQQERKVGLVLAGEPAVLSSAYGARLATNELWGIFGK